MASAMFDSLASLVDGQRKPLARDLTDVKVRGVAVAVPSRAVVLTRTVWTFRVEATAEILGRAEQREHTTRSLEDFAWLRRALVFAVPGAIVPPGPLAAFAASKDSVPTGEAPLTKEEAETLRDTAQVFFRRMLDHVELRDEPLFKSFCVDEPERWDSRKSEAESALKVAPPAVQIGAKWSFATETIGFASSTNIAAAKITASDRAEMDTSSQWQQWVVARDRSAEKCEQKTRTDADAALHRARATSDLFEVLAEAADQGTSTTKTQQPWLGRPFRPATSFEEGAPPEEEEEETTICQTLSDAAAVRRAHVALFRDLADLRAYLAAAQEALNMRDLCRRESWTARRHCAEKRASFGEREAQLKLAAQREEQASSAGDAFRALSLTAQSTFASYHADAMLSTKNDVTKAEKLDGLLRHRFDVAKIRLYAHLDWLAASWNLRCERGLALFAALDAERKDLVLTRQRTALSFVKPSDDRLYNIPAYAPPDFAKELARIKQEDTTDVLDPTRSSSTAGSLTQDVVPATPPPDTIVTEAAAADDTLTDVTLTDDDDDKAAEEAAI